MAKLLGILNDGIGGVISHAKIILTAQHNSAKVLKGTQSIIDTDSQGAYSFTVQPSHYTVALRLPEGADLILGSIVVNSDSKNGTLNDFLLTPNDVSIITPEILLQIQQCRTEAQHAAEQALTAERNAAKTLEGAVKKAGDTMIGDLAIKKNLPIFKMINAAGDYEFRITAANGNYTQIATTTSDGNVRTTLRWNKLTNTWNFENSSVLINGVPVLKKGDYGLGADVTANTIIGDISKILSTGFYIVNQSTTGNVPFPACSLFVQRINATEQTAIAVSTFNNWPIKTGVYTNGAWLWQTHVTTTNIKDHALPIMGGSINGNLGIKKGRPVLYLNNTDNGQQVNIALGKNFAISFMEAEKEKFFLIYNPTTGDTEFNAPVQLSKNRITDITTSSSSPGKSSLSDAVIKGETWGVFSGSDTPTLGKTSNLTIASWYGVGFAPLYGTGVSNNTVAIDTRKGLINTRGGVYENGVKLIKQGDGGFYGYTNQALTDIKDIQNSPSSIFIVNTSTLNGNIGAANLLAMRRINLASNYWSAISVSVGGTPQGEIFNCDNGNLKSAKLLTTANSTVDSNGFYKKASPIIRLFANNNITEMDGFIKSGCGLVNSEAACVSAKRIAVGHYEIHGSLGFAKEGWYITLPEDANGNKKIFAHYQTDNNHIITVKTYQRRFDVEQCEIVAGEPIDIPPTRWIDIRLEVAKNQSEEKALVI